jgi:cobaltochelatase CobT
MRGARQQITAQAIDLAVHALEACQIRCEVLGFTTRFGAKNPIVDQWRRMGSPIEPGRLNALRHIVYKTPNQPWRGNRHQLGLLLREGFGHENIDGEALHWAACRLMRQPQPRKILIVLSDGSPYDRSTALANGRTYLENHLREVITKIELSPIHLVALGASQDVGRFYRHALKLHQPESVAEVLFDQLAELLTRPTFLKPYPMNTSL